MNLNLHKTKEFVLLRFKENKGGFGATPLLPPTLEDTYFGVKALSYLDKALLENISPKVYAFLSNFLKDDFLDALALYRIFILCEILRKEIPQEFLVYAKNQLEAFLSFEKNSSRLYALWYISKKINKKDAQDQIKKILSKIPIKTIEDLYYLGQIEKNLWFKHKEFVISSQNGDGGFGFYPKTTSYLENTYYALKILSLSTSLEREIFSKALEFIRVCQNRDGGFGRKPGGVSFLETTSYAVEIMQEVMNRGERI